MLNYTKFINEKYVESTSNVDMNNPIDLIVDYPNYIFADATPELLKQFNNEIIKPNSNYRQYGIKSVVLYHGTSVKNNIMDMGLKVTTNPTKKSYQSQVGYVYLSVFPDHARRFGEIAYPYDDVVVYKITIPIYNLLPDLDQLYNHNITDKSLTKSLLIAHTARVKGDIPTYMIEKTNL